MYLTLIDMFTVISLITEVEKGPAPGDDNSELARIRNKLFADVWSNPTQMKRMNEVKKKFLAEITEALEDKEDYT